MADAADLKSEARKGVRVRIPPPAPPILNLSDALGGTLTTVNGGTLTVTLTVTQAMTPPTGSR